MSTQYDSVPSEDEAIDRIAGKRLAVDDLINSPERTRAELIEFANRMSLPTYECSEKMELVTILIEDLKFRISLDLDRSTEHDLNLMLDNVVPAVFGRK